MTSGAAGVVLLVEDSRSILDLLAVTLDLEGVVTREVGDNFERLLDPASPLWRGVRTVCSDIHLSGHTSGVDILRVAEQHHPHIRRVALTAAMDDLLMQVRDVAHVVLPKPAPFSDIVLELK